ncbi:MAG: hypothetical protein N3A66_09460, partial [Planctomycetota bacterium]|nr:hypothetical protein [Planctomycetota bacterium]
QWDKKLNRIWGRTPKAAYDWTKDQTTALVMCYQENLHIQDGSGAWVPGENGSHRRQWVNVLYESGHARRLNGYRQRMLEIDAKIMAGQYLGYVRPTAEACAGNDW